MRVQEVITKEQKKRYFLLDDHGEIILPVAKFLKYKDISGSARNTLRAYCYRLKLYFEFLQQKQKIIQEVEVGDIAEFIYWLRNPHGDIKVLSINQSEPKRTAKTINQVLDTVISFYDYLLLHKEYETTLSQNLKKQLLGSKRGYKDFLYHVNKNKYYDVKRLKLKEPVKKLKILSVDQVQSILRVCLNPRDRFLIYLLYETGMRIGEALSLHREDIQFGSRKITIVDRGEQENDAEIKTPSSERTLDVTPDLMNLYDDYFFEYLDREEVDTDFVFIQISGKHKYEPLTYQCVNSVIKRIRKKTGIDFTPHVLRHTCLTELWRSKKMRPEILRLRAGHKQIQTTLQMYIHPSEEDIALEWQAALETKKRNELNRRNN